MTSFHLRIEFDCRPGAIAQSLALREPKYQETAAYCHFGREPVTKTLSLKSCWKSRDLVPLFTVKAIQNVVAHVA